MNRKIAFALLMARLAFGQFPQAELSNPQIRAKLYLPDPQAGYYRATRFDWSGVISSLEWNGHNYFGQWFNRYDPKLHDSITGPVEEFLTNASGLGYDEVKPGESFVKIGVGALRRPDDAPFRQFATYEITNPGKWTVHQSAEEIEFTHELGDTGGYAYLYHKTVRLEGNRLILEHRLRNTGRKTISTSVYEHNFFMLDGQASGPDTVLRFRFDPHAKADLHGLADTEGTDVRYLRELERGQSVFTELNGYGETAADNDIRVENTKTGAAVRQTGDHALSKLVLWSIRTTVCPEAYIDLQVEAGKEVSWRIAYEFYAAQASPPAKATRTNAGDRTMYVGTYTRGASKGIYGYRFDSLTGKSAPIGLVAETENPSFLAIHPSQRFLYAANEISKYEGQSAGSVSAFAIDPGTHALKLLNRVSSRGAGPCHVAVDKTGKWLFVANYNSGSVAAFPIHEDGSLGEASAFFQHAGSSLNKERQSGPHAHVVALSPDNRFVLVADLGLDRVFSYRVDSSNGGLAANDPAFVMLAPGSGPRHLAFRPDGKFVYSINEMLSTVTAFRYDASRARLKELQTLSTLPNGWSGSSTTAEIVVHPNSRFLYASNRGDDSIAIFRIDPSRGALTFVDRTPTQGKTPRNFAIDPSGAFLLAANQDSGSIVTFRIDPSTGRLASSGDALEVPSPVCILFAQPQ
ncbi:MAG TPA: beta-propeller fold lactonase family protein [Bryobacteraceae bacterium]|jgi:6-phosphogluconolactonase|nr:beta-propeller fold lactonase family protein [Bryobacteraceae bacterium]